ncbi:MAG: methyltransferase [Bacteriovoracaceae bacterium]|nr:methyltransferase [Bacteriovoracaceae bacterium]
MDYSQPDFYRFSEDSIGLVKFANSFLPQSKSFDILDLCAGSGVIALEFAQLRPVNKIVFVEVQDEFIPHLKRNAENFFKHEYEIVHAPLSQFTHALKPDIIFSNPPYFATTANLISPNKNKAICRSFVIDSLEILFQTVGKQLEVGGYFFLVHIEPPDYFFTLSHKYNLDIKSSQKFKTCHLICFVRL